MAVRACVYVRAIYAYGGRLNIGNGFCWLAQIASEHTKLGNGYKMCYHVFYLQPHKQWLNQQRRHRAYATSKILFIGHVNVINGK